MADIGIAGAGFSGAVIGRELADAGHRITVFDTRNHVAGNCHTERDAASDVMVHIYGPHIFHTQWEHVWDYINRYGSMRRYNHRVKATTGGTVYSLPVNLHTINQFFGTTMSPAEAHAFVAAKAEPRDEIVSFEDQGLAFVGPELYEAFLAGYTRKQWGTDPRDLPASILQRLPLRFNYDDSYFNHPYQAIPEHGYTPIVEAILDHPAIEVRLSTALGSSDLDAFDHVVWTGPIDAFFDHEHGRLGYRTLDFERELHDGDYPGLSGDELLRPGRAVHADHRAQALRALGVARQDGDLPRVQPDGRAGRHPLLPGAPRAREGAVAGLRRAGQGGARTSRSSGASARTATSTWT